MQGKRSGRESDEGEVGEAWFVVGAEPTEGTPVAIGDNSKIVRIAPGLSLGSDREFPVGFVILVPEGAGGVQTVTEEGARLHGNHVPVVWSDSLQKLVAGFDLAEVGASFRGGLELEDFGVDLPTDDDVDDGIHQGA